jgi:hypothetical protein
LLSQYIGSGADQPIVRPGAGQQRGNAYRMYLCCPQSDEPSYDRGESGHAGFLVLNTQLRRSVPIINALKSAMKLH